MSEHPTLLITDSERVADAVGAAAAALGVAVEHVRTPGEAAARWGEAALVFVGEDQAAALAATGPPRRPGVYLVGWTPEELGRLSVPLGGQVVVLPDGLAALTAVLSDDHGAGAPLIAVLGGSGGVGASTLAVGLALAARRRGAATALVDADPLGGGLDLLLGAERTPGWRWPGLAGARGEVTDMRRFLPQVEGVTVVSMGRASPGAEAPEAPTAESARAVVRALARHHDLVVLDAGRGSAAAARPLLASCRSVLLVVGSGVRAVASGAAVAAASGAPELRVVVRRGAGSPVAPESVGRALGLPVIGVLPDDRSLPRAAEEGDVPGRGVRNRWARAVDGLLDAVVA